MTIDPTIRKEERKQNTGCKYICTLCRVIKTRFKKKNRPKKRERGRGKERERQTQREREYGEKVRTRRGGEKESIQKKKDFTRSRVTIGVVSQSTRII